MLTFLTPPLGARDYFIGLPRALFFGTFLGVLIVALNVFQLLSLVILPFSRPAFRAFNTGCAGLWWGLCVDISERFIGLKYTYSGDAIPESENALVFANHQQMPDIAAVLWLAKQKKMVRHCKWMAKKALSYVPGVGWGLKFLDCLFLERNWYSDQDRILGVFKNLVDDRVPLWLVTFSEGTRINPTKLTASQIYAEKAGLPRPERVLIPRTKGFVASVQGLGTHITAVYDVTIGYPGGIPRLWRLAIGQVHEIRIHARRFPLETLPKDEKALSLWLSERFREKENVIPKLSGN